MSDLFRLDDDSTMTSLISSQPAMTARAVRRRIRVLAVIEANTVTGPAKNLLEFCRIARDSQVGPIVDMTIITFQRVGAESSVAQLGSNEFTEQALQDGIEVHCISERYTFDWEVIRNLRRIVDRLDPDVIQTHGLKSHFLIRVCGAHKDRVWVAFHHGYTNSTLRRAILTQLDRWSLQAPSQVVTVSEAFSRVLSSRGVRSGRITVLHNAIDPDWLWRKPGCQDSAPQESASKVLHAEKLVLAVGRLSKEKGFLDLVAAIRHLQRMRPDFKVRLAIVGEGLERKAIEETIRGAGLEQQVSLVGYVKDVRPYYRAADLLAISSLSEGSPNALLEAMAAGVPVVATAVGGIPEIVADGETALLVPPRDPEALALAMARLLSDHNLAEKMALRARELIKAQYSPLARAKSLVMLYERLCMSTGPDAGSSVTHVNNRTPVANGNN